MLKLLYMPHRRFQTERHYSAGELLVMGGEDQQQVEEEPGESHTPDGRIIFKEYGQGDAAVEAMMQEGYDFSNTGSALEERNRRIGEISKEIPQAKAIEASRLAVAQAYTQQRHLS